MILIKGDAHNLKVATFKFSTGDQVKKASNLGQEFGPLTTKTDMGRGRVTSNETSSFPKTTSSILGWPGCSTGIFSISFRILCQHTLIETGPEVIQC